MKTLGPKSGIRWVGNRQRQCDAQAYVNRRQARAYAWHSKSPEGKAALTLALQRSAAAAKAEAEAETQDDVVEIQRYANQAAAEAAAS